MAKAATNLQARHADRMILGDRNIVFCILSFIVCINNVIIIMKGQVKGNATSCTPECNCMRFSTLFIPFMPEVAVFVIVGATGGGALLLVVIVVILCALIVRKFHSTTDHDGSKSKLHTK